MNSQNMSVQVCECVNIVFINEMAYRHQEGAEQFVNGLAEPVQFAHELPEYPLALTHFKNQQRQMQNDEQIDDAESKHVNKHVLSRGLGQELPAAPDAFVTVTADCGQHVADHHNDQPGKFRKFFLWKIIFGFKFLDRFLLNVSKKLCDRRYGD